MKNVNENRKGVSLRGTEAGAELYLFYTMIQGLYQLLKDAKSKLELKKCTLAQEQKMYFNVIKTMTNKLMHALESFDNDYTEAYAGNYDNLDLLNKDANDYIRLLLLVIDRVGDNSEKLAALEDFLTHMPSRGKFSEDTIEKFHLKLK